MVRANTVGSRLSVNLKTKAISQTERMPSPRTATRRNRRFSNLTIHYRAAIRLRVEKPADRLALWLLIGRRRISKLFYYLLYPEGTRRLARRKLPDARCCATIVCMGTKTNACSTNHLT